MGNGAAGATLYTLDDWLETQRNLCRQAFFLSALFLEPALKSLPTIFARFDAKAKQDQRAEHQHYPEHHKDRNRPERVNNKIATP